jgi:hypothetical protein
LNKLHRFVNNPWVAFSGWAVGILSIVLSIALYVWTIERSDIAYATSPTRTAIVKAGVASELRVTHRNKSLTSDVSSLTFAIWNEGRKPIRSDAILAPFWLTLAKNSPILEARLKKKSRALTGIQLDTRQAAEGRLGITWTILEQGDGAVIDVIYAGAPNVDFRVTGTVVGQRAPREINPIQKISRSRWEYYSFGILFSVIALVVCGLSVICGAFVVRSRTRRGEALWTPLVVATVIACVLNVSLATLLVLRLRMTSPPFGW